MRFMESTPLAESQVELGSRLTSLCGDAANPLRSEGFQPKPTPISVVKEPIQSPGIHLSAAGLTGSPRPNWTYYAETAIRYKSDAQSFIGLPTELLESL